MANSNWNGRATMALAVGLVGAVATGAYATGVHFGNKEIHQTSDQKRALIQDSIDREIGPQLKDIRRELAQVNRKLDALAQQAE